MDRSPANLGDIINTIQRDLDELKMAQAAGPSEGSIVGDMIAEDTITSDKLDWTSLTNAYEAYSSQGSKSLDISSMPTGAVFAVIVMGYVQLQSSGSFSIQSTYNGTSGEATWWNKPSGGSAFSGSMSNMAFYTKASGADSVTIALGTGTQTSNECKFSALAIRIG